MTKEIIKVEENRELNHCTVTVRVPQFENFGEKLKEIEQAAEQAWQSHHKIAPSDKEVGNGIGQKDELEKDPSVLLVHPPTEEKWIPTYESQLDGFLNEWPHLRNQVLEKTFEMYQQYFQEVEFVAPNPAAEFILPEPTSAERISHHFRITSIMLHEDGRIGIYGRCTWDDEHGFGAMIQDGQVLTVGHADEAFY